MSLMAAAPDEPFCRDFRLAQCTSTSPVESSASHAVGVPESTGMPGVCQKDTRIAPGEAFASASNSPSLSRLSLRRQAASPTPLDSNSLSRMASLSISGSLIAGASRRASVLFPLHGRPESTTKRLDVRWGDS
jgi:hypothetical protein